MRGKKHLDFWKLVRQKSRGFAVALEHYERENCEICMLIVSAIIL